MPQGRRTLGRNQGQPQNSALLLSEETKQRLCIARLLTIEPEIILLDEPCSALDPIATMRVEELMMELKKDYTILIVTHNMQQGPGLGFHGLHVPGRTDRNRPHGRHLHPAQGLPNRGLYYREVWVRLTKYYTIDPTSFFL